MNFRGTTLSIQLGWATLFGSSLAPHQPPEKQVRLPENDGLAERMRRRNVEFELRYGNHRHTMKALETLTGAAAIVGTVAASIPAIVRSFSGLGTDSEIPIVSSPPFDWSLVQVPHFFVVLASQVNRKSCCSWWSPWRFIPTSHCPARITATAAALSASSTRGTCRS